MNVGKACKGSLMTSRWSWVTIGIVSHALRPPAEQSVSDTRYYDVLKKHMLR